MLGLSLISGLPSLELYLDDIIETLVLWEVSINSMQVNLVHLEYLKEIVNSNKFPPIVLVEDGEASSQDVSNVSTSSNIGWKRSIRDGQQDRSCVIKDDIEISDILNGILDFLHIFSHKVSDSLPAVVNIVDLIDVKNARVWSELLPDFVVNREVDERLQVLHCIGKSVHVRSSRSVVKPSNSLQTDSSIDNFNVKLLSCSVMESLVLHKHHVSYF